VGGHQVRKSPPWAANIVNASPAADVVPVLLALDATVTCLGPGGERTLPLDASSSSRAGPPGGPESSSPQSVSPRCPRGPPPPSSRRAGARPWRSRSSAWPRGLHARRGRRALPRTCVSRSAPSPRRRGARGRPSAPSRAARRRRRLREAGRLAAAECRPISDVRASARYRTLLVEALVPRALTRWPRALREGAS